MHYDYPRRDDGVAVGHQRRGGRRSRPPSSVVLATRHAAGAVVESCFRPNVGATRVGLRLRRLCRPGRLDAD